MLKSTKEQTTRKQPSDYKRLRPFDVLAVDGATKLIFNLKAGETKIKCFVKNKEMLHVGFK